MTSQTSTTNIKLITSITLALLLRSLIAIQPHSGQNNHHGSKVAYGGDFEAQRHWMELTYTLPLSKWYSYDTSYWGLDYPPLTAYGSYICGMASYVLVGEYSIALDSSRGIENAIHKSFMRGTVIGFDIVLYFPIVYFILKRLVNSTTNTGGGAGGTDGGTTNTVLSLLLLGVLIQPALVIIDHGHFQYNAVCLGLALASFHFMTKIEQTRNNNNNDDDEHEHEHVDDKNHNRFGIGMNCIIGSIYYCLALNWKQMALYYAPVVFAYLLGRCFYSPSKSSSIGIMTLVKRVGILGMTVIITFGILWYPFYYYRDDLNQSVVDVFGVILRRIFPFSRGLFEGKVGNLWCVASVKPISIRERIPQSIQPLCALSLTLLMALPFCILLFQMGRMGGTAAKKNDKNHANNILHLRALLWGATGSSLSFFLASFQVHEKSILLSLAPLSLLVSEDKKSTRTLIHWFSIVSIWSMWHLLVVDRLGVAYFASIVVYLCYVYYMYSIETPGTLAKDEEQSTAYSSMKWKYWDEKRSIFMNNCVIPVSIIAMMSLHVLEIFITPPSTLPDLFPVLWVIVSCLSFCFMWLMTLWELLLVFSLWSTTLALEGDELRQKKNE